MRIDEIRALGPAELDKELENSYQELFNLRMRLATRQLTNYREIPKVKKKIARLKTVKRERVLAQGNQ